MGVRSGSAEQGGDVAGGGKGKGKWRSKRGIGRGRRACRNPCRTSLHTKLRISHPTSSCGMPRGILERLGTFGSFLFYKSFQEEIKRFATQLSGEHEEDLNLAG